MTTQQLEEELSRLDRQHRTEQRVARREHALAQRDAREGRTPPSPAQRAAPDIGRSLVAAELQRRQRPARIALLLDPPGYLTRTLGPVPEQITERRRWLKLASDLESVREQAGFNDGRQALPRRAQDATLRADIRALEQRIQQGRTQTRGSDRAQQLER